MRRFLAGSILALLCAMGLLAQDPPSRIARLNYISGNVSMQPAGLEDWTPAEPNRPFTGGDTVYTDIGSRAEFHLDTAVIRAGEYTNFGFLTLNDQTTQLRLTEGDLYVNLRDLGQDQVFEVDSPNAAVSLLRRGIYRFRIAANGALTFVVVREGQAEITGGGQAFNLTPGNSASISGTEQLSYNVELAPAPDEFDSWCQDRDAREARYESERYLPPGVVGAEDMNQYGDWQADDSYGSVWYPRTVAAGWAPYRYGHWAWIEPWGWTWVDDAPWGFAPFHYGRWAYISGRWGWCPGPIAIVANRPPVARPVYAPALVAWFGGSRFGVAIQSGGPSLGWVPLGYGEVYTPSYQCSPRYFNNVNVSNTTVVKTVNITNVYNTVYVNKTVYNQRFVNVQAPNAVTAMPQTAFASGRPVSQGGVSVPARQVQAIQPQAAGLIAPPVAPNRQALIASNITRATVAMPPAQVLARQVVVRTTPAISPSSFNARQPYLVQTAGQPHNFVSMHQQVAPNSGQIPNAKVAAVTPAVKPVNTQAGERFVQPTPQVRAQEEPARPQVPSRPEPAVREAPPAREVQPQREAAPREMPQHENVQPRAMPVPSLSQPVHEAYPAREKVTAAPPAHVNKPAAPPEDKDKHSDTKKK